MKKLLALSLFIFTCRAELAATTNKFGHQPRCRNALIEAALANNPPMSKVLGRRHIGAYHNFNLRYAAKGQAFYPVEAPEINMFQFAESRDEIILRIKAELAQAVAENKTEIETDLGFIQKKSKIWKRDGFGPVGLNATQKRIRTATFEFLETNELIMEFVTVGRFDPASIPESYKNSPFWEETFDKRTYKLKIRWDTSPAEQELANKTH